MTDERPGDPKAVRHLRPTRSPARRSAIVDELPPPPDDFVDDEELAQVEVMLAKLRAPFPPEMIEKLPKPTFKGAWDNKRAGSCPTCHGYHVLDNCIHLDYVGHANVTNRLLEVDPFWEWEPMAYTEQGTPLFTDGGLWIKLTVCGVTRLGYGDGKSVKEVIGDAIRNAAMRFGVALDLWSKIDLHAERNPGDGEASRPARRGRGAKPAEAKQDAGRAANQDALDALLEVCNEHGYSTQYCIDRWAKEHDGQRIENGDSDAIFDFAAKLVAEATPDPDASPGGDPDGGGGAGSVLPAAEGGHGGSGQAAGSLDDPLGDSARGPEPEGPMF